MNDTTNWFDRTVKLIGEEPFLKLQNSTVAVVGIGGVGSACCEALCRGGVGKLIILDHDTVSKTNLNRQIVATVDNIGEKKIIAMKKRLNSIVPDCEIITIDEFYDEETTNSLFSYKIDFVVDAIDTIKSKIKLAKTCKEKNIPIIACLGTGNRLDPTMFKIGDIKETQGCGCGLARVMRREYKTNEIFEIEVLYSTEIPQKIVVDNENGKHSPASISFCPPVAGFIIASRVISRLIKNN